MTFQWNPDKIRFMRDAGEYCTYYGDIAGALLPFLENTDHICDAGCGLGYLSLELAKRVKKVTSVDLSPDALSVLKENCTAHRITNIDTICEDIFSQSPPERYPAMVFCYFGDIEDIVNNAERLCSGPVFIIKRVYDCHRFSFNSQNRTSDTFDEACRKLDGMGLAYKTAKLTSEFGQPFRNYEDAEIFYRIYNHDSFDPGHKERFFGSLEKTGREDYPLYFPNQKNVGLITVNISQQNVTATDLSG